MEEASLIRLILHLLRLLPAIVFGAIVRFARKLLGRKPRIWHGLSPIYWDSYMVQASRVAGYETHFLLRDSPSARDIATMIPGVRLLGEAFGIPNDAIHWAALRDLFWWADIKFCYFDVMYFGQSLPWANALVLRLAKLCGIRIIVGAHGGDVTYRARYRSRFDWIGRVQQHYQDWDLIATTPGTLWRIDTYCRVADLVLPGDATLARLIPRNDILFKYFPIDTKALPNAGVSDREVPVVVHAPSVRAIKGTDELLAALENLRGKGIAFELRLVEKMPRLEALKVYETADVVVDQLCIGAYGTLSVEAMALGKPTLTYLDQEHLSDPVFNMPLVNAHPENVERVLAVVLQVPELRRRLAAASREAIEKYQSIEVLAEVWDQIYRYVWSGTPLQLEKTRHFDPSRTPRSFVEDPALPEFWPVAVEDLMDDIGRALARIR